VLSLPPGGVRTRALCLLLAALLVVSLQAQPQAHAMHRTYVWEYAGRTWSLSYAFPSSVYDAQRSSPRNLVYSAYGSYVSDPRDDEILRDFLGQVERLAAGLNIWDRLNLILALVQSLPYAEESCEYPRYPLETLIDQRGDCEDAAILAVALVREMGFSAVLLAFLEERHVGVGIRVLPPCYADLQAYEWGGDLYYYLEATSPGWEIGQLPSAFQSQPVVVAIPSTVVRSGT